eukprot:9512109-Lingulodinium_polyedra.AAC.1
MSVSSSWRCRACPFHEWLSQGCKRLAAVDPVEYSSQSRTSSGSAATYAGSVRGLSSHVPMFSSTP